MGRAPSSVGNSPSGHIDDQINEAYVAVKKVADNIDTLVDLAVDIDAVVDAKTVALASKVAAETAETNAETASAAAIAANTTAQAAQTAAQASATAAAGSAVAAAQAATEVGFWGGYQNLTVTRIGQNEYLLACPADAPGDGRAFVQLRNDFDVRLRPVQNNKLINVGLSNASGFAAALFEELRFQADGQALPFLSNVEQSLTTSYKAYAANDYRWFTRSDLDVNINKDGQYREDSTSIKSIGTVANTHEYFHVILDQGSSIYIRFAIGQDDLIASHSIGYRRGGSVIQLTTKTANVTLNEPTGSISLHNGSAIPANGQINFLLNNNYITGNSMLVLSIDGLNTENLIVKGDCADGGGRIYVHNLGSVDFTTGATIRFMLLQMG